MGKSQVPAKYVWARTENYNLSSPYPKYCVKNRDEYVLCYCIYMADAIAIAEALTTHTNKAERKGKL